MNSVADLFTLYDYDVSIYIDIWYNKNNIGGILTN